METKQTKKLVYAIIIFVIYAALLVIGFVGYFSHALDSLIGGLGFTSKVKETQFTVEYANEAYANIICMMFLAMTPSVLLYIGARSPFRIPFVARIVLFLVGTAGLVGMAIVYGTVCSQYSGVTDALGDALGLKLSIAIGVIGFVVLYLLSILPIEPENIRIKIFRFVIKFCRTDIFCIIVTLLFTIFLFPLFVIIAAIVAALIFFMLIAIFVRLTGGTSSSGSGATYTVTANGTTYELKPTNYVIDRYAETYTDQFGHYWLTKDHGKTFYRHDG